MEVTTEEATTAPEETAATEATTTATTAGTPTTGPTEEPTTPEPATTCLQDRLDAFCQQLVKPGMCENFEYARHDGLKWRCYETLGETEDTQCVDDDGEMSGCTAFATDSNKCTANQPMIEIVDEGCIEPTTQPPTTEEPTEPPTTTEPGTV